MAVLEGTFRVRATAPRLDVSADEPAIEDHYSEPITAGEQPG
jgi:hypothetical protein